MTPCPRRLFRITIPTMNTSGSACPPPDGESLVPPLSARTGTGYSVLLVDDAAEIRDIVSAMLKRTGYIVEVAEDGEAGWEALNRGTFDLVITDQVMPRPTGIELLRRIRKKDRRLPVIVISGFCSGDDDDFGGLLIPGTFIAKPFSFLTLLNAVVMQLTNRGHPADSNRVSATA